MSFGDNVAYLFRQLGIYEEFDKASLIENQLHIRDEHANLDFTVDFSPRSALYVLYLEDIWKVSGKGKEGEGGDRFTQNQREREGKLTCLSFQTELAVERI